MNVLLLGATGHIGGWILRVLSAREHKVTVLARNASIWKLPVIYFDLIESDDPADSLKNLTTHFDWIVDAAAPYPLDSFVPESVFDDAENRMNSLLQFANKSESGFAYVSSFITLPCTNASLLSNWKHRSSPYYVMKARLEHMVQRKIDAGLQGLIANPSACFGPGDYRPYEQCIIPNIANNELTITIDRQVDVVDVRDVANSMVDLMENGGAKHPVPMFGNTIPVSMFIEVISNILDVEKPLAIPISDSILSIVAMLVEASAKAFNMTIPTPALTLLLLTEDFSKCDRGEFSPSTPFEKTIADALDWYGEISYC